MKIDRLTLFTGLSGLALLGLGAVMYGRERKALGLASGAGLGRGKVAQAQIVGGYSDGNMRTTMRSDRRMPIEQRVATIQDLIHKSVQDPEMRKVALQITSQCPERDKICEAKAIYHYVKRNVRYTGDIAAIKHPDGSVEGIDLYQSARRTLFDMRGGDCDDQSIVIATLLALNGIEPTLRIVKTRGAPDWEHIFSGFKTSTGKFVALDSTLPGDRSFGVEPRYHKSLDFPA